MASFSRLSIRLPDDLLESIKRASLKEDRSINAIIMRTLKKAYLVGEPVDTSKLESSEAKQLAVLSDDVIITTLASEGLLDGIDPDDYGVEVDSVRRNADKFVPIFKSHGVI